MAKQVVMLKKCSKCNIEKSIEAFIKQNFPKDEYQLLCMNCNFAKGLYSGCPHQRQ